jgi:hypothetical protein
LNVDGLAGGINQFEYVRNNPQNAKDPSGLYEIDVHHYLTYFLAKKNGCFSDAEAREIRTGTSVLMKTQKHGLLTATPKDSGKSMRSITGFIQEVINHILMRTGGMPRWVEAAV